MINNMAGPELQCAPYVPALQSGTPGPEAITHLLTCWVFLLGIGWVRLGPRSELVGGCGFSLKINSYPPIKSTDRNTLHIQILALNYRAGVTQRVSTDDELN
jgi:hypothetical protein